MTNLDRLVRWGPLALILVVAVAVYASGLNRYVSPHFLKERHDELKAYVGAHYWLSLLGFTLFFTLLTAVAVPGAVFAQLGAGFLFGMWTGGIAIALAATLGALVIYGATRTAFGAVLRKRVEARPGAFQKLQAALQRDSFWVLLSVRLAPVVPFVLVNVASGLAGIPLRRYVTATFLGTLPTNLVYASIGQGLDRTFAQGGEAGFNLLLDGRVAGPLCALAALSLIPVAARLARDRWPSKARA